MALKALSLKRVLVAVCLLALACGGSKSPTAPSPFSQTVTGTVSVFGTAQHTLSIPRAGNMTITLSWSGNVDLDLYLSNPSCTALYPLSSCGILVAADGFVNPEKISRTVSSGESFKIWIDNNSQTQSMTYTLTTTIN